MLEQPAACAEGDGAKGLFSRALATSPAPEAGWSVHVRIEKTPGGLTATGEMFDARSLPVANRIFKSEGTTCAPLAKAIGVWSSLVLDNQPAVTPEAPKTAAPVVASEVPWLPMAPPPEKASPEQYLFLRHPEASARSLEIGAATFIMDGLGTGGLFGGAIFGVAELGGGFFLRPALAIGQSIGDNVHDAGIAFTRIDGCGRIPGFYRERRGMQLDLCGGADVGVIRTNGRTLGFFAPGPAIALRGELASELSAELRGAALINLTRVSELDAQGASLFAGRAEFALTWRLR
ncbi:MAG: hypothetical protein ABIP39_15985 [Polyangiaceae bacterium]